MLATSQSAATHLDYYAGILFTFIPCFEEKGHTAVINSMMNAQLCKNMCLMLVQDCNLHLWTAKS